MPSRRRTFRKKKLQKRSNKRSFKRSINRKNNPKTQRKQRNQKNQRNQRTQKKQIRRKHLTIRKRKQYGGEASFINFSFLLDDNNIIKYLPSTFVILNSQNRENYVKMVELRVLKNEIMNLIEVEGIKDLSEYNLLQIIQDLNEETCKNFYKKEIIDVVLGYFFGICD